MEKGIDRLFEQFKNMNGKDRKALLKLAKILGKRNALSRIICFCIRSFPKPSIKLLRLSVNREGLKKMNVIEAKKSMALLDQNDPINISYTRIREKIILLSEETGVDFQTLCNEFFKFLEREFSQYQLKSPPMGERHGNGE